MLICRWGGYFRFSELPCRAGSRVVEVGRLGAPDPSCAAWLLFGGCIWLRLHMHWVHTPDLFLRCWTGGVAVYHCHFIGDTGVSSNRFATLGFSKYEAESENMIANAARCPPQPSRARRWHRNNKDFLNQSAQKVRSTYCTVMGCNDRGHALVAPHSPGAQQTSFWRNLLRGNGPPFFGSRGVSLSLDRRAKKNHAPRAAKTAAQVLRTGYGRRL